MEATYSDRGLSQMTILIKLEAHARARRLRLHGHECVEHVVVRLHRRQQGRLQWHADRHGAHTARALSRVRVLVHDAVEGRARASLGRDAEVAAPRRQPVAHEDAVAAPRRRNRLEDNGAEHGRLRCRRRHLADDLCQTRRVQEAIDVHLKPEGTTCLHVDCVEDAVAAMESVVVKRYHEQRRISDNST